VLLLKERIHELEEQTIAAWRGLLVLMSLNSVYTTTQSD